MIVHVLLVLAVLLNLLRWHLGAPALDMDVMVAAALLLPLLSYRS